MITDIIEENDNINEIPFQEDSPTEDINATYEFASGNIDPDDSLEEFISDLQKPKEETGVSEEPDDDDLNDADDIDPVTSEQARYTAQFIVDMTDEIAARSLAMLSTNSVDSHRAGKEQKKHLKNLWTKYCKEKGTDIPIGWQITLTMLTVYGSQVPKALHDRKLNEKQKQVEESERRLQLDREIFEQEKRIFREKQENTHNNPADK